MKRLVVLAAMVVALFAFSVPAFADASLVPNAIWAEGQLYGTVVTPTALPDKGPFTPIYNFSGSQLSGQRSISAAGPGDPGFYGGRWKVFSAAYTESGIQHFGNGSGQLKAGLELMSLSELEEAISDGYVTVAPTDVRFVCTLVPGKPS